MASSPLLQSLTDVSPAMVDFLDRHFASAEDLSSSSSILGHLEAERQGMLEQQAVLRSSLAGLASMAASRVNAEAESLQRLAQHVHAAQCRADAAGAEMTATVEELAELAEEVTRIERTRAYMEALLVLESQVADLEDAVAAATKREGISPGALIAAATAFQTVANTLAAMADTRSHWKHMREAADIRLDRAAAVLHPLALGAYRTCLRDIGWPLPLSSASGPSQSSPYSKHEEQSKNDPILRLHGETKGRFENLFASLSIVQVVEKLRRNRQELVHRRVRAPEQANWQRQSQSRWNSERLSESEVLWSMEELVAPIARRAEPHLVRWLERPELVFALVFRVARSHVEIMDVALQPVLDSASLVGISAREEWVKAVVAIATAHLKDRLLPWLAQQTKGEQSQDLNSSLLLDAVDQALDFDVQMRSLAMGTPVASSRALEGPLPDTVGVNIGSALDVFALQSVWLELWTRLELEDAQQKLREELQRESAWTQVDSTAATLEFLEGGREMSAAIDSGGAMETELRPMPGAEALFRIMWAAVYRCRALRISKHRLAFVRAVVAPLATQYREALLNRVQEVEASTALADTTAMMKVAACASSAHYCQFTLQQWSDEAFFIELKRVAEETDSTANGWEELQVDPDEGIGGDFSDANTQRTPFSSKGSGVDSSGSSLTGAGIEGSVFDAEIDGFVRSQTEWTGRILTALLRGFDSRCTEYVRNRKKWQEGTVQDDSSRSSSSDAVRSPAKDVRRKESEGWARQLLGGLQLRPIFFYEVEGQDVSGSFIEPLSVLRSQLDVLQRALDSDLFAGLWRRLAAALDENLMESVVLGGAKFSDAGARQFAVDMSAVFSLFRGYTARPINFFRSLRDSLAVLLMAPSEASALLLMLSMAGTEAGTGEGGSEADSKLLPLLQKRNIRRMAPGRVLEVLNQRVGIKRP